ncbi:MAG: ABC transporter permease [Paralcaligenes sp.]
MPPSASIIASLGKGNAKAGKLGVLSNRAKRRAVYSILLGLILWELVGRFVVTDPILFAPLSKVLVALWKFLYTGEIWRHIYVSAIEFVLGFTLATVTGVLLGVLMATNRMAQDYLDPWVYFFYCSPLVALMPFYIMIFGVALASKIAIVFTVAVFPILLNTFVGIRSADAHLLEVGRAFNCTRHQTFLNILLPSALPFIVTGLQLGVGRGLTGVVVGELFASREGVGYLIATASQSFDTPILLMGVLLFSIAGVLLMAIFKYVERRCAPWKQSQEAETE